MAGSGGEEAAPATAMPARKRRRGRTGGRSAPRRRRRAGSRPPTPARRRGTGRWPAAAPAAAVTAEPTRACRECESRILGSLIMSETARPAIWPVQRSHGSHGTNKITGSHGCTGYTDQKKYIFSVIRVIRGLPRGICLTRSPSSDPRITDNREPRMHGYTKKKVPRILFSSSDRPGATDGTECTDQKK